MAAAAGAGKAAAAAAAAGAGTAVKPIFSRNLAEAKRRVRELYRAWYREIPNTGEGRMTSAAARAHQGRCWSGLPLAAACLCPTPEFQGARTRLEFIALRVGEPEPGSALLCSAAPRSPPSCARGCAYPRGWHLSWGSPG